MPFEEFPDSPWLGLPDSAPPLGIPLEICAEFSPVKSVVMVALARLDPTERRLLWLNAETRQPIVGLRRVSHWKRLDLEAGMKISA